MRFTIKTLMVIFCSLIFSYVNAQEKVLSGQRITELNNLLIQDCGSCHGMTMKGGLGPALTAEVLKSKPRELIEKTITYGRPGTPMPPWNKILTKKEINWMVDTLYQGINNE